jgi:hypothetical protein
MQIRYDCPNDGCVAIIEYEPLEDCGPLIECPRCHTPHEMKLSEAVRSNHNVDRCVICGGSELFVRKDFPQKLGLGIVVVFGLASLYFFRTNLVVAWLILLAAVVLDLVIYLLTGKVTACYACRAEYRGSVLNHAHEGFDLATSEKY